MSSQNCFQSVPLNPQLKPWLHVHQQFTLPRGHVQRSQTEAILSYQHETETPSEER